jgi:hypothetical protein
MLCASPEGKVGGLVLVAGRHSIVRNRPASPPPISPSTVGHPHRWSNCLTVTVLRKQNDLLWQRRRYSD